MIEIKKPTGTAGGTQLITETFDLIALGVDFTTLNISPFTIINAIPGQKIQPLVMNFDYYSIGNQTGAFYFSNHAETLNSTTALYAWLSNGVVPDQSGSVTYQMFGTAPFANSNNPAGYNYEIWTPNNEINASYNTAILTITYIVI